MRKKTRNRKVQYDNKDMKENNAQNYHVDYFKISLKILNYGLIG